MTCEVIDLNDGKTVEIEAENEFDALRALFAKEHPDTEIPRFAQMNRSFSLGHFATLQKNQ